MCSHHKKSLLTETTPRKPLGSEEERAPFWGKKNNYNTDTFAGMVSSRRVKAMTAAKTSEWRAMGKRKTKNFIFLSLITLDFPHSAVSQNYLFESGVLFYTYGAKSLLTPSKKSASSVCLWIPSSLNHVITCQPLPAVCQCLCCTIALLRNISRGKSRLCVLTVAHTYIHIL